LGPDPDVGPVVRIAGEADMVGKYVPPSAFFSVLEEGLPALPDRMTAGHPMPVAVWVGSRYGAVMYLDDCPHDPGCPDGEHYLAMTYAYRRGPGGWELPAGGGGTDWPGGTSSSTRGSLANDAVIISGGRSGSSQAWMCREVSGFTGAAARWVELTDGPLTVRQPIPDSGAFVVALGEHGPATVRILDSDDTLIETFEL
jgi:hypothetical protein